TRLQVEHPVTEMICGVDLVKLQLQVAEGKPLPMKQEDLHIRGHAIEARIYAEDPLRNFMPDTGVLKVYQAPGGPGVRVDNGYEQGMSVPVYYDPMLAKLICHASTREEAIDKMIRAIDDFHITGVSTTLPFCRFAVDHQAFRSGAFDTHFVEKHYRPELLSDSPGTDSNHRLAVAIAAREVLRTKHAIKPTLNRSESNWRKNRSHG
ncbi:MAG: biotin carboxylase, partial [Bacteroidota bacterium]